MIYPGYGVARNISGPPVLLEPIADRRASDSSEIVIAWTGDYAAVFLDLFNVRPATDGVQASCRTSSDGGATFDAGASDYFYRQIGWFASQLTLVGPAAFLPISMDVAGSDPTEYTQMSLILLNPFDVAKHTQIIGSGGKQGNTLNPGSLALYGQREEAGRVDAVRLYMSSGNIAEGRFTATGLRKG